MKKFLFFPLLISHAIAFPLTLQQIEKRLENSHPLYLSIVEQKEAHHAQMQSEYASTPFVLSAGGAEANPTGADKEFEYNVGVSKSFFFREPTKRETSN